MQLIAESVSKASPFAMLQYELFYLSNLTNKKSSLVVNKISFMAEKASFDEIHDNTKSTAKCLSCAGT